MVDLSIVMKTFTMSGICSVTRCHQDIALIGEKGSGKSTLVRSPAGPSWIRCQTRHDCHHQGEGVRIHLGLQVQSPFRTIKSTICRLICTGDSLKFIIIYIHLYTFIIIYIILYTHLFQIWILHYLSFLGPWLPQFPLKVDSVILRPRTRNIFCYRDMSSRDLLQHRTFLD